MNPFGAYSRYYDLLYRDKDYPGEARFVNDLLESYGSGTRSVLELGCGTGIHAALLAEQGYSVHGVDLSEEMLVQARSRRLSLPAEISARLDFSRGDLRGFRMDRKFDAVLSLFHVMSYQTTEQDLISAFSTARAHLGEGGIFIFDCWYGPAVLRDLPATRVKRLEDDRIEVTRIAEPLLQVNRNLVEVRYEILIRDKSCGRVETVHESHPMRYLFYPEIEGLFERAGMKLVFSCEWMTGKEPGADTWGVCFGGRL